jgi:plasmid replication initiation protein
MRLIIIHAKPGKVRKIPLMSEAVYEEKAGRIMVSFNPKIVPNLIGLREKFSSSLPKKAVNFSSSYAWRFYELLVSWAQPKKDTNGIFMGWIDKQAVEELREMMGVPDSYTWGMFEQRVILSLNVN